MRIALKLVFLFFLLTSFLTHSQGDGPESHFLKPQKMWGLNFKYLKSTTEHVCQWRYFNAKSRFKN